MIYLGLPSFFFSSTNWWFFSETDKFLLFYLNKSSKYVNKFLFKIVSQNILLIMAEKAAGPMDIP